MKILLEIFIDRFFQFGNRLGVILMDDARDSAGAKLAVVLVSVHIIEEKDSRIFLAALIRPYDVGPVEAEDRHGRLDHPLVMADRFRKERLAVPDHEALAPDKDRYILAVDQLVIDGFWRQEDEISLELIKVARDELALRETVIFSFNIDQ